EVEVLERRADAENIVVGSDHPDRAIWLEQPPRSLEPGAGEGVIMGKAVELVPIVIKGIDLGLVGPGQTLLELQIVRWIGENQINAAGRQGIHVVDAIAHENSVDREAGSPFRMRLNGLTRGTQHTLNPNAAPPIPLRGVRVKGGFARR